MLSGASTGGGAVSSLDISINFSFYAIDDSVIEHLAMKIFKGNLALNLYGTGNSLPMTVGNPVKIRDVQYQTINQLCLYNLQGNT